MSVLFGHPSGNPASHHAALAHYQAGWLESLCVAWMPSVATINVLNLLGKASPMLARLRRRHFAPLAQAPKTQSRLGEFTRLAARALGSDSDRLAVQANEWLMRTMTGMADIKRVSAVHAYEDCSLRQFRRARQLGKACLYDMPIGYYPAWERIAAGLVDKYSAWLAPHKSVPLVSPKQKREEMALADLVLAPSAFVAGTIREAAPEKAIAIAPYGVDAADWTFRPETRANGKLTFLFVGQCSLRKGTPLLLEAWRAAALPDAQVQLVGSWRLAEAKKKELPPGCSWVGPVSAERLREIYAAADIFVFPTNFEGRALVIGEALASGLPILTTKASGMDDAVDESCGRIIAAESLDELVESLRWFARNAGHLPQMKKAARARAQACSWDKYRASVIDAVRPFAGAPV
jgi:glycosyltransferase involved in cell wall biosynthesis